MKTSPGRSVAVVFAIALAAVVGTAQEPFEGKAVASPSGQWSISVPLSWTAKAAAADQEFTESVHLLGPPLHPAFVSVQVFAQNLPLAAIGFSIKTALAKKGTKLESESRPKIGGRDAYRCEWLLVQGEKTLRMRQAIVDGGPRKVLVTTAFAEPVREDDAQTFEQILASLTVTDTPAAAKPLVYERRSIPEDGIEVDLPGGGALTRKGAGFQILWQEGGLLFLLDHQRTALSASDYARYDFQSSAEGPEAGMAFEIADEADVKTPQGTAHRIHAYARLNQARFMSITSFSIAAGPGEMLTVGFARLKEVPFTELADLEAKLAGMKVTPVLAAPLAAAPVLAVAAEIWQGRATASLPEGWAIAPTAAAPVAKNAPSPAEEKLWCATGARDLGVTCATGTMTGGRAAYEKWLREKKVRQGNAPVVANPRAIQVDGRPADVFEIEYGPPQDRWIGSVVVAFDGERYDAVECACPARLKAAYGGLAERVAASVRAKR